MTWEKLLKTIQEDCRGDFHMDAAEALVAWKRGFASYCADLEAGRWIQIPEDEPGKSER